MPLHPGNDLVRIAGHEKQADGTVTHIFGRVLDVDGKAVPQARIEIWQCDAHGRYHDVDDDGCHDRSIPISRATG